MFRSGINWSTCKTTSKRQFKNLSCDVTEQLITIGDTLDEILVDVTSELIDYNNLN